MKPLIQGNPFSRVDVTHISTHGLWLLTNSRELFVSFVDFPQFQTTSSSKLKHVIQLHSGCLYWPDLGVEIPVKRVRCFPLVSAKPRPILRAGRPTHPRSVTVDETETDKRDSSHRSSLLRSGAKST